MATVLRTLCTKYKDPGIKRWDKHQRETNVTSTWDEDVDTRGDGRDGVFAQDVRPQASLF